MLDLEYVEVIKKAMHEMDGGNGLIGLGPKWVETNLKPFNPELAEKCQQMIKLHKEIDDAFDDLFEQVCDQEDPD